MVVGLSLNKLKVALEGKMETKLNSAILMVSYGASAASASTPQAAARSFLAGYML